MNGFLTIDENLRCAMQFFGRASGSGTVEALDGAMAIFSGLDYGVFNIGLVTRRVMDGDLEKQVAQLGRFFSKRTLRWSLWLCEDMLDTAVRRREKSIFSNCGMRPISHPPGMLAPALLPPVHPLAEIEMRPVADAATRSAFAEITSIAFEIPYTVAHAVYMRQQAWGGDYRGFVGFADGKPVSIVAIVAAAEAIGVYSLATVPGFRRRGYAEALLRAAASEVSRQTGFTQVLLQSTDAGYALYQRMGFRDATKYTVYLTK